jgi:hypothetical protein
MKTRVKRYASVEALEAALAHVRWLTRTGLDVCDVIATDKRSLQLELEWIDGKSAAGDDDLVAIAAQLGLWHGRLVNHELRDQSINTDHRSHGVWLRGFSGPRRRVLDQRLLHGADRAGIDAAIAQALERTPVSVYKDANIRNVIMTSAGPWHVDPDQLGLAPAGYDLAKLLVSSAMTTGHRPAVEATLNAYNGAFEDVACDRAALAVWLEVHDMLTAPYVGRHYAYRWRDVRTVSDLDELVRALRRASS